MVKYLKMCGFVLLVFFLQVCYAQNYQISFDAVPVTINNNVSCVSPFNGGIDQPRFQFLDIDGDGKLDLFIYDKDTVLNYYHNEGSSSNPVFRMQSLKYLNIPVRNWFVFVDINHRGIYDLFTGGNFQTVRFFKNTGTLQNPNYVKWLDTVKTNTDSVIYSESVCTPTFTDIDSSGTLDFFTGNSIGTVIYYKNIGTPQNFNFKFETGEFGGILIIGGGANKPGLPQPKLDMHGASAITFSDMANDGKMDLFWGDFFGRSIYWIKNTGSTHNFTWNTIDTNNPKPSPWFSAGYNMPGLVDIDGDGKKDFFVGVLIGSLTKDNFAYYKNTGTLSNPQFTLITKNFIPCIDVGANSYPAFCDINNDSLPDLFIGCGDSRISYYKNTGTRFSPVLTLVTDSLPILKTSFNYVPAFGDLDGDGKKDMVIGEYDGKLRYFKNTGTIQNPVFTFTASQLDNISVAQSSAPVLADLNGDGLLDLLIGDSGGHLAYYLNDGTQTAFHFTLVSSAYQGIFVGNDSAPTLSDIDGDGDLDLLAGNRLGKVYYYRNDGTVQNPNFVLVSNSYAGVNVANYSVPAVVDLFGHGNKDLVIGNVKGGLFYYENTANIGISQISSEVPVGFSLHQNYPNPFNPTTKIRFEVPHLSGNQIVTIKIYDVIGRESATLVSQALKAGTYETDWDAGKFASGVYYYVLSAGEFKEAKKLVLVK